jgi:transposase-like protein
MSRPSRYPAELRQRAVRMVAEMRPNYDSVWAAITAVAQKLGIGTTEAHPRVSLSGCQQGRGSCRADRGPLRACS